jgi:hypothetical protein
MSSSKSFMVKNVNDVGPNFIFHLCYQKSYFIMIVEYLMRQN